MEQDNVRTQVPPVRNPGPVLPPNQQIYGEQYDQRSSPDR